MDEWELLQVRKRVLISSNEWKLMFVKNLEAGLTVGIPVIDIKYPDFLSCTISFFLFFPINLCIISFAIRKLHVECHMVLN